MRINFISAFFTAAVFSSFLPSGALAAEGDPSLLPDSVLAEFENKGVLIHSDSRYMYVDDTDGRVAGSLDPQEYFGLFYPVRKANTSNEYYLRLGNFEYICAHEGDLRAFSKDVVQKQTDEWRERCIYIIEKQGDSFSYSSPFADDAKQKFLIKNKRVDQYVRRPAAEAAGFLSFSESELEETRWFISHERDIVPDLGVLEQFFTNGLGNDGEGDLLVEIRSSSVDKVMSLPSHNEARLTDNTVNDERSQWIITRLKRKGTEITIKNAHTKKFLCDAGNEIHGQAFGSKCHFIPVRVSPSEFVLFNTNSQSYVNRDSDGRVRRTAQVATHPSVQKFTVTLAPQKGSTIELIDVEFDEVINEGIAFIPDEVRTLKFKNSSPVDQQQEVTLSKEKSVSVTTSWSVALSVETTFSREFSVGLKKKKIQASATSSFSLSIGFSSEFGREHSRQVTVGVDQTKTFIIPACTEMRVVIAQATSTGQSVPFVAVLRQNFHDGKTKTRRVPGVQSGVAFDQTSVEIFTEAIPGCAAEAPARRLLRA